MDTPRPLKADAVVVGAAGDAGGFPEAVQRRRAAPVVPKWVRFVLQQPRANGTKTDLWWVCAKEAGNALGCVRWHAPWRKYAFFPGLGTLYEPTCLRDIAAFIDQQMEARRKR